MGTINDLNTVDTLADDDKLVIWKTQAGATRGITAANAASYFETEAGGPFQPLDATLTAAAALGFQNRMIWRGTGTDTAQNVTGSQIINVYNVLDYGAVPDCIKGTGGVATSGDATFTDSGAAWTSADIGKTITIVGAGAAGAALSTTIASINSATSIELAVAPSTTVGSNCVYLYGTPAQNLIELAFNAALAAGGGTVVIAGDSRGNAFLCTDSIYPDLLDADIIVEFRGGTLLYAGAGMAAPVLKLWASASNESTWKEYDLAIFNPRVDCSLGSTPSAGQFCTGISAQYSRNVLIDNPWLYGGTDPDNTNADTGIDAVGCKFVYIRGGSIEGFGDVGVYPNGDNTVGAGGDDGLVTLIDGTLFRFNQNAVSPKRELNLLRVVNCTFEGNTAPIVSTSTGSGGSFVGQARRMEIEGNVFKKNTANIARFRGITKGSFKDNRIEDWGYAYDGTGGVGANAIAVNIIGSSDVQIEGNTFCMVDWVSDDERPIQITQLIDADTPPTTYNPVRITGSGNTYLDVARCLVCDVHASEMMFTGEKVSNIGTAIINASFPSDSLFEYETIGRPGKVRQIGQYTTGEWVVVASSGASVSHTGNTTETTLAAPAIPGGLVGPNGVIRITTSWTVTNNANVKNALVRLGGAAGAAIQNINLASTRSFSKVIIVTNRNSESSQIISSTNTSTVPYEKSASDLPTATQNTANDIAIAIRGTLASAGDTITLESYMVEVQYRA